jgi:hypothetical protein
MVRMSLFTTVAAVAFLSFSTAGIAGPGEAGASKAGTKAISNCNGASRIFVTQSSSSQTTSSTAFVDVIGSLTSFTTTATKCVIIDFSAQAFAPPTASGLMFVRALLDGVTASVDGEIQFVAQSNTLSDAQPTARPEEIRHPPAVIGRTTGHWHQAEGQSSPQTL